MPAPTKSDDKRFGPKPHVEGQKRRGRPRKTQPEPVASRPKRGPGRPRRDDTSQETVNDQEDSDATTPQRHLQETTGWSLGQKRKTMTEPGPGNQLARRSSSKPPSWCRVMRPSPIEEALKKAAGATTEDGEVKTEAEEDLIESIAKIKNDVEGWQELWVMMLHIFQSTPYDLFTWGLRESDEGERQVLYQCLCHLLPHPLWEGEISRLRYALQKAISFRVAGHLEPLGPLPLETARVIASTQLLRTNRGAMAMLIWDSLKMETQKLGGDFLIQLRAEVARASYNPWEPGDDEILFQLGVSDIEAVRDALDITALRGSHGGLTVRSHYDAYSEIMRRSQVKLAPSDRETLARWDRWSLTARHFDETSQEPDYPRRDRDTYKSLPYWESDKCDERFKQCIHSPMSSLRVIMSQPSACHAGKKPRVSSGTGAMDSIMIEDDSEGIDVMESDNGIEPASGIEAAGWYLGDV